MSDNRLVAALLTLASHSIKPKADPTKMGIHDWRLVVEEYDLILDELNKNQPESETAH